VCAKLREITKMIKNIVHKFQELQDTTAYQMSSHNCMIIGHYGENHAAEQLAKKFEAVKWRVCRVGFYGAINKKPVVQDLVLSAFMSMKEVSDYREHRKYIKVANLVNLLGSDLEFILIMQNDMMFDLEGVTIPVHYYHTEILHPYLPNGITNLIYAYPEAEYQLARIFPKEFQEVSKRVYIPHAVNINIFRTKDLNDFNEWSKRKILFGFKGIESFEKIGDYLQDNLYNLREEFLPVAKELGLHAPAGQMWTKDYSNFMKDTKIALNIPGLYGGINQRMMEAPAAGCILLNWYVEGMEDIGFIDGKTCYTFKDAKELKEKYKYISTHLEEALKVAKNGYNMVNNNHCYIHRALQFIVFHFSS